MEGTDNCDSVDLPILNLTDPITHEAWLYTPIEEWFVKLLFPLTLLIGVVGNGAFMYTVLRIKRMHTITNYYLFNLAIADIIYIGFNTIGFIITYIQSPIRYDTFIQTTIGCYTLVLPIYASYEASICLVTLVTLERYYGILMPLKHRYISTKSRTIKIIALSWLISIVLGTSATLLFGRRQSYCVVWPAESEFEGYPDRAGFCEPLHADLVLFCELCKSVPFFVALVWNIYMFARIINSLSNRDIVQSPNSDGVDDRMTKVRNQVARMLIINGSIFFICQVWTRIASFDVILAQLFGSGFLTTTQYNIILPFSRGMLFVNGTVNPIVYSATSPLYRQSFKEALFGCVIDRKKLISAEKSTSGSTLDTYATG